MLTDAELEAMDARATAATPGLWIAREDRHTIHLTIDDCLLDESLQVWADNTSRYGIIPQGVITSADAKFIAAARADVPALLAEVRRLRHDIQRVVASAYHNIHCRINDRGENECNCYIGFLASTLAIKETP